VAVFLVGTLFVTRFAFLPQTGTVVERGVFGGPSADPSAASGILIATAQGAETGALTDQGLATFVSDADVSGSSGQLAPAQMPADIVDQGALQDPGQPIGPSVARTGLIDYTVRNGDSLSKIASYFGVSVQTILSANPGIKAGSLKAGVDLKILPTSGVIYETKPGDTLASIAAAFGIPQDKITQFNASVNFNSLESGQSIVVPGGTDSAITTTQAGGPVLPNFDKNFIMPTVGYNWGILHHENAVDIANSCGTPVDAAASGIVVPDPDESNQIGGWNGGYGNFVLIQHAFGNNIETRYAHLEKVLVQIGDYVTQGQEIGLMGETGDATGCHLHFEVLGAHNPFVK